MKTLRKYCKVSDYKTPMNKRNKKGDMLKHVPLLVLDLSILFLNRRKSYVNNICFLKHFLSEFLNVFRRQRRYDILEIFGVILIDTGLVIIVQQVHPVSIVSLTLL